MQSLFFKQPLHIRPGTFIKNVFF